MSFIVEISTLINLYYVVCLLVPQNQAKKYVFLLNIYLYDKQVMQHKLVNNN